MKHSFLHQKSSKKLILFFAGWGQDEAPFQSLESIDYDVLLLYNYAEKETEAFDFLSLQNKYDEVHLIAWSFGVFMANKSLKDLDLKLQSSLAINGTIAPIDNQFGIPNKVYDLTLDNFSEKVAFSFSKKMCLGSSKAQAYLENLPKRSINDLENELAFLKKDYLGSIITKFLNFNTAYIAKNDFIFPSPKQENFWSEQQNTKIILGENTSHFPFYEWENWDSILNITN